MELVKDMLINLIMNEDIFNFFPNLKFNVAEMLEMKSFSALQKIKAILENDNLSDFECIEEIVCILETIGSDSGNRHDFG